MDDYVLAARKQYQPKMLKAFKHDLVYNILKRKLPKFELVISNLDARVVRALFVLVSDPTLDVMMRTSNTAGTCATALVTIAASALLTPRPTIGKKKAKAWQFARPR